MAALKRLHGRRNHFPCHGDDLSRRFHFISGLPRSGSTLLSALLAQNPRFRAGMTSPVGALVGGMLAQLSAGSEYAAAADEATRMRLLRGIFDSFYADGHPAEVIFDTNRSWCARLPAIRSLFPGAKIIACVRNVAWVMDSIERLYRAAPFENTRLFASDSERGTVYSRLEALAQRDRLVGYAWSALKEAYYATEADSMLVIDYDLLVQAPGRTMNLVYDFIGEPHFAHDFNNVQYDAAEFDMGLGVKGLHKVRPVVGLEPRRTVLPPDLFEKYAGLSFWQDGAGSGAHVIRPRAEALHTQSPFPQTVQQQG